MGRRGSRVSFLSEFSFGLGFGLEGLLAYTFNGGA